MPGLDKPFEEEIFPNVQSKPLLAQLEAVSSCPIPCYLEERSVQPLTWGMTAQQVEFINTNNSL